MQTMTLICDALTQVEANATLLNEMLEVLIELLLHGRNLVVDYVVSGLFGC